MRGRRCAQMLRLLILILPAACNHPSAPLPRPRRRARDAPRSRRGAAAPRQAAHRVRARLARRPAPKKHSCVRLCSGGEGQRGGGGLRQAQCPAPSPGRVREAIRAAASCEQGRPAARVCVQSWVPSRTHDWEEDVVKWPQLRGSDGWWVSGTFSRAPTTMHPRVCLCAAGGAHGLCRFLPFPWRGPRPSLYARPPNPMLSGAGRWW